MEYEAEVKDMLYGPEKSKSACCWGTAALFPKLQYSLEIST